jgi:hypothetical protein
MNNESSITLQRTILKIMASYGQFDQPQQLSFDMSDVERSDSRGLQKSFYQSDKFKKYLTISYLLWLALAGLTIFNLYLAYKCSFHHVVPKDYVYTRNGFGNYELIDPNEIDGAGMVKRSGDGNSTDTTTPSNATPPHPLYQA